MLTRIVSLELIQSSLLVFFVLRKVVAFGSYGGTMLRQSEHNDIFVFFGRSSLIEAWSYFRIPVSNEISWYVALERSFISLSAPLCGILCAHSGRGVGVSWQRSIFVLLMLLIQLFRHCLVSFVYVQHRRRTSLDSKPKFPSFVGRKLELASRRFVRKL